MPDEGLVLALGLMLLGSEKKVSTDRGWYYDYMSGGLGVWIEFPGGTWECSFCDLMERDDTVHSAYRAQIFIYKDNRANMVAHFTQLKEFFLASGYIGFGHHLVVKNFIIQGPCTLVGQVGQDLDETFRLKLAAMVKKIA